MKIRNAIIITDADSALQMTLAEQPDFTGNVVFTREKLPADLALALDSALGRPCGESEPSVRQAWQRAAD